MLAIAPFHPGVIMWLPPAIRFVRNCKINVAHVLYCLPLVGSSTSFTLCLKIYKAEEEFCCFLGPASITSLNTLSVARVLWICLIICIEVIAASSASSSFLSRVFNEQLVASVVLIKLLETSIIACLAKSLQFPEETFHCDFCEAHAGSGWLIVPLRDSFWEPYFHILQEVFEPYFASMRLLDSSNYDDIPSCYTC